MIAHSQLMAALRELYRDNPDALRNFLPELADGLHAQVMALHGAPSEAACEALVDRLDVARGLVCRLADAIRMEVQHGA
jgi:hypothetical protein